MGQIWDSFEQKCRELNDFWNASRLISWDQLVLMPPEGAQARARLLGTLGTEAHRRLTDPEIGRLIDELGDDDSLTPEQAASVRVMKRDHERAVKVPEALVREQAEVEALAYQTWTEARTEDDFSIFEPHLDRIVLLKKEEADVVGWEGDRYNALLDDYEPDATASDVAQLFEELARGLRPIAETVLDAAGSPPGFLSGPYDPAKQDSFCRKLVARLGFEFDAGRLDTSAHPFTQRVAAGDVRMTTRYAPDSILPSLYAAIHETGHALYEQGLPRELMGLPAGRVPSLGLHESQSRLWENHVGRSRAFSAFMLPRLKELFPDELGTVPPDEFYRGVNHPSRSLIRVEADELTYNLHVILRFELELALFRDELKTSELPDAWDDKMEEHIGLRPSGAAQGVLQDMHWSVGMQGYFPTYTIGTLYAAAFFAKAEEELGSLNEDFATGKIGRLLEWLRANVHAQAYVLPPKALGEKILGRPLTPRPYLDYLKKKFGEIYDITF